MNVPEPPRSWYASLATWPIDALWLLWVIFTHGVGAVLMISLVGVAGAILWFPAVILDRYIGPPVAEFGVIVIAVMAACSFVRDCFADAKAKWQACPW
jgi:hypothetical protein